MFTIGFDKTISILAALFVSTTIITGCSDVDDENWNDIAQAEEALHTEDIGLGRGYDSLHDEYTQHTCIDYTEKPATSLGQQTNLDLYMLEGTKSLYDKLDIKASAGAQGILGMDVNAKAAFARERTFNSYHIYLLVKSTVRNAAHSLDDNPAITNKAARLFDDQGTNAFYDQCGNEYISSYTIGGEYYGIIEIKTESAKERTDVSSKMNTEGTWWQAKGELEKEIASTIDMTRVEIHSYQNGGYGEDSIPPVTVSEMVERARNMPVIVKDHGGIVDFATMSYSRLIDFPDATYRKNYDTLQQLFSSWQDNQEEMADAKADATECPKAAEVLEDERAKLEAAIRDCLDNNNCHEVEINEDNDEILQDLLATCADNLQRLTEEKQKMLKCPATINALESRKSNINDAIDTCLKRQSCEVPTFETAPICSSYHIEQKNTQHRLDGSTNQNPTVYTHGANSGDYQKWGVYSNGDGTYRITHKVSGRVLEADSDGDVFLGKLTMTNAFQKWKLYSNGDGTYRFTHVKTGQVLDATTAGIVSLNKWNSGSYQRWVLSGLS